MKKTIKLKIKGIKGEKGDTPSKDELVSIITPLIPEPIKGDTGEKGEKGDRGENGKDGVDGYTPIKNVDYFDGVKGEKGDKGDDGKDVDESVVNELQEKVNRALNIASRDYDFAELKDVSITNPTNGQVPKYNSTTGKWENGNDTGSTSFITLTDTPSSYSGQAGKFPKVNATEDGLEFGTIAPPSTPSLQQVTDVGATTTNDISVPDEAYGVGWNGSLEVPTKNALYDKIETITTTPAGSDTQVQFNDSGAFGGDSSFIWDRTNDRLGIQATTPQVPLHVASVTGTTLNDVVTGSATLVTETLPTAPTGSITQIAEPIAPSSGSVSFIDQGSGAYQANGSVYTYRVYTMLDAGGGTYYRSQYYSDISNTDPNDSDYYNVSVYWSDVTISGETVAYYVEKDVNGGGFSDFGVYTSTSFTDSGSGSGGSYTAWPTFYANSGGTAPDAPSSLDTATQNSGGSGYYASGNTILYEFDQYKNIGGTDYVSGSPVAYNGGAGFTDDSSMTNYSVDLGWTFGGSTYDGIILRKSFDSGSSWVYIKLDSGSYPGYYNDDNYGDDGSGSSWGNTYPGGVAVQHDFAPYGRGTSPSGNTVYSTVGSTYSTTVPADSVNYIFKHSLSGGSSPYKILAPQASPTNGVNMTGTFYDAGYTSWADTVTVTPNSYGFTGTAQNRDYKIYSSGSSIFGATPLTVSTVTGSGAKSVSLSWTLPSGITTVKILRQVNGGGYTVSKTVNGTSATDDVTDGTWNGNTTVTPTSIVGGTARFDKALTTLSEDGQLQIISTGSGTRYSKISFGVANNSSSSPSFTSHIYSNSSTGYVGIATGRLNIESSLGGTVTTILGSTNVFNNHQNSSAHFNIKGQTDANLFTTRSDQDTVGFGSAIGSDQQTTVQIQPARSTDNALTLIGHASMSATSVLLRTQTSAGSYGGTITVGGAFQGGSDSASVPSHSWRSDSNTGLFNVSADVIGVTVGGTERERRNTTGRFFGGSTAPTDLVHIGAGTTSVAPLRLTTGSLTTGANIRAGQLQFLTDKLHFTITTGTAVKEIALNDSALTSGTFPVATTNGRLQNSSFTTTNLASGTYTPTLTGVTNVSSSTARQATYMRVGNTVTVSGQLDITTTGNNTRTTIGISLPIASAFSTGYELGGTAHTLVNASANDSEHASVSADATNDRAELDFFETKGATETFAYTFTYQII